MRVPFVSNRIETPPTHVTLIQGLQAQTLNQIKSTVTTFRNNVSDPEIVITVLEEDMEPKQMFSDSFLKRRTLLMRPVRLSQEFRNSHDRN